MKNKVIYFVIFILFFFYPTLINAAGYSYSVGRLYPPSSKGGTTGINSIPHANETANTFKALGYSGNVNTNPSYSALTGNIPNTNRKVMHSDILYFGGHSTSSWMDFGVGKAGDYKLAITNRYNDTSNCSGYKCLGLKSFNMSTVKLAIFQGCSTAGIIDPMPVNLPTTAVVQGAKTSLGWSSSITAPDNLLWLSKFDSKLSTYTVAQAASYANTFIYMDNRVKNTVIYGDRNLKLNTVKKANHIRNDSIKRNDKVVKVLTSRKTLLSDMKRLIREHFNSSFNFDNYRIETNESDENIIIDIVLYINDVKTNIGYTVFLNKNMEITNLYDNSNYLKSSDVLLKLSKKNVLKLPMLNENLKLINKNTGFIEKDSYFYYDIFLEQLYIVKEVEYTNKLTGAFSISNLMVTV